METDFDKIIAELGYATAVYPKVGGYTVGGFKKGVPDFLVITPPDEEGWFIHPALVLEPIMDLVLEGELTVSDGSTVSAERLNIEGDWTFTFQAVPQETLEHLPHMHQKYPNPTVFRVLHEEDRGVAVDARTFTQAPE